MGQKFNETKILKAMGKGTQTFEETGACYFDLFRSEANIDR